MKISLLSRLYIKAALAETQILSLDTGYLHYLRNVLRLQKGDKIRIFNDIDGEFEASINDFSKQQIFLKVGKTLRAVAPPSLYLSLGLCIIKADKMLDALDMSTQLGVTEITPIMSDFSQASVNLERVEKRIIQATQQSERFCPPLINPPMLLQDYNQASDLIIYANEKEAEENNILRLSSRLQGRVALLIGPEGGFSDQEQLMLASWPNAKSISLGSEVLRTETAVVAALAQLKLINTRS